MVQANPQPAAQGGSSNTRKVRPIPIGEDHLQFKHDPQIQGQLDHNGKFKAKEEKKENLQKIECTIPFENWPKMPKFSKKSIHLFQKARKME